MSADIKAEVNIPDVWFDIFSRIFPGVIFIGFSRYFILDYKNIPSFEELLILIFFGYSSALITQPFSSRIVESLENIIGKKRNPEKGFTNRQFIRSVQKILTLESRSSLVISKMHAETSFFIQLFVLGIIYLFMQHFLNKFIGYSLYINLAVIIIAFGNAIEVTFRRFQRVLDHYCIIQKQIDDEKKKDEEKKLEEKQILNSVNNTIENKTKSSFFRRLFDKIKGTKNA